MLIQLKDPPTNMSRPPKAPAGHFTILYFGPASSYTSKNSEPLPAPLPLSKLFPTLEERYSGFKAKLLETCLVTVNLEYVDVPSDSLSAGNEIVIKEGDEVALIPPVSSG
jgi:molybdopterin converting factor small subunit